MSKYFFLGAFVLSSIFLFGQKGEIRGVVLDKNTGEPIIGANVFLAITPPVGTATDVNGFYTIDKVPYGKYTLVASNIGYDTIRIAIEVRDKVLNKTIYIKESAYDLEEFTISAEAQEKREQVKIGQSTLDQKTLKTLVTVGGEPDLVQSLQVLPGVITTGDQGGQLYIRGGSPVMNKVLLDGVTIYNPFHSIGLFSIFDSDIIRTADVYSAGFGAQYGGRVSAVVDVVTREGNKTRLAGKLAANPFTSKVLLEGPIKKFKEGGGSSSFVLSYKNSYLDKSSKIFYSQLGENKLPYAFDDLYGKISINGSSGSKFEAFGFNFNDRVNYQNSTQFNWKSSGGGMRFVAIPDAAKTLFDGFVSFSKYQMNQIEKDNLPRQSDINGFNVGLNFTYLMGKNDVKYGIETNGFRTNFETYNSAGRRLEQFDNNTEISFYIRHRHVFNRLVIEPGFRLQYYASLQEFSPEPRMSAKYNVSTNIRITAAAGMYSQNLMSAVSDRDVVNLFYGFLASPENLPSTYKGNEVTSHLQKSRHYVAGTEIDITKNLDILVEAYYKDFNQITNINRDKIFDDNTKYSDKADYLKKDYIIEQGDAMGIDFRIKWEYKKIYLWVVYSYTYITRDDGIREYFPNFDRRHNVNVVGAYTWGKNSSWEVNGRFSFGSGFPFTQTQGFFEQLPFTGPIDQDYVKENGNLGILYGEVNKGRLPTFHRLDLSLKKNYKLSKYSELNIIASVINVYDRANIFYFDRVNYTRINQLPFLPSLGINFSF